MQHNPELTANKVVNLMEGRAVKSGDRWLQLDLNDKDQDGNYRMKQFYPAYGFDLEKTLEQWAIKEMKKPDLKQQLISALRSGEKVQATLDLKGEKVAVNMQVNPQFKTMTVLKTDGQKVSLAQAQGKQVRARQTMKMEQKPALKIGRQKKLSIG